MWHGISSILWIEMGSQGNFCNSRDPSGILESGLWQKCGKKVEPHNVGDVGRIRLNRLARYTRIQDYFPHNTPTDPSYLGVGGFMTVIYDGHILTVMSDGHL